MWYNNPIARWTISLYHQIYIWEPKKLSGARFSLPIWIFHITALHSQDINNFVVYIVLLWAFASLLLLSFRSILSLLFQAFSAAQPIPVLKSSTADKPIKIRSKAIKFLMQTYPHHTWLFISYLALGKSKRSLRVRLIAIRSKVSMTLLSGCSIKLIRCSCKASFCYI